MAKINSWPGMKDFSCRLILICLTHHWMNKLRDEITYPGSSYLPKWFPSEINSFIGILIVLRCFSMVRRDLLKYITSIAIYTALDWTSSHEGCKKALTPICSAQVLLIISRTFPFDRLRTEYKSALFTSVIFGGLKVFEITNNKLFFTDHVFLLYLTVILLPEPLVPRFTFGEIECLKTANHLSVFYSRLNISNAFPAFGAYWVILKALKLWKFCLYGEQIFGQGFHSPFQVFAMVCFISVTTDWVTDRLMCWLYPSTRQLPTPFPLMLGCQLFAFLFDDGIWNMDPDQQWELIILTLLIPVMQALLLAEYWFRGFFVEALLPNFSQKFTKIGVHLVRFFLIYFVSAFIAFRLWTNSMNDPRSFYVVVLSAEVALYVVLSTLQWVFGAYLWFNHSKVFYDKTFKILLKSVAIASASIRTIIFVYIMFFQLGGIFRLREIVKDTLTTRDMLRKLKLKVAIVRASYTFVRGLRKTTEKDRKGALKGVNCPVCQENMDFACATRCIRNKRSKVGHYYHIPCLEAMLIETPNSLCALCQRALL